MSPYDDGYDGGYREGVYDSSLVLRDLNMRLDEALGECTRLSDVVDVLLAQVSSFTDDRE